MKKLHRTFFYQLFTAIFKFIRHGYDYSIHFVKIVIFKNIVQSVYLFVV